MGDLTVRTIGVAIAVFALPWGVQHESIAMRALRILASDLTQGLTRLWEAALHCYIPSHGLALLRGFEFVDGRHFLIICPRSIPLCIGRPD